MHRTRNRLFVALAVGLLGLMTAGLAVAGETTSDTDGEKVALTGCLSQDSTGIFSLVESESGDSITVEAPDDLGIDTHVGHMVKVTGQWAESEGQDRYFQVTEIEMVSESCQA